MRMLLKKQWWLFPVILAIALVIWWKEERCQSQTYQCRANYTAKLSGVKPNEEAAEQQAIAAACEPDSYFCRLFSATNLPSVLLVLIGFGGIWAAIETLRAIKTELVLNQRPKILLHKFYFTEMRGTIPVPSGIQNNSFCNGQFYIRNVGGSTAHVEEIHCEVWAVEAQGRLPMKCPYEGIVGKQGRWRLSPGQSMTWLFGSTEPLSPNGAVARATGTSPVYVLGQIIYRDDLGIPRSFGFCRKYDGRTERFVPIGDPDYEYAD